MSSVLMVNIPFSNLRWPNLGPSLLKAGLARQGVGCDIAYFNFDFAERAGLDDYYWIADDFAFVLGGERLFAKDYFGGLLPDDEGYFRQVLKKADPRISDDEGRQYAALGRHVAGFLQQCLDAVDWSRYPVVGFAATFQQTMPSLCLARRIKARRPETVILFGGAACEGEMGIELLRQFPEIDYVFLGEADLTFPPVVRQILAGQPVQLPPGVVGRRTPADVGRIGNPSVDDTGLLDGLPIHPMESDLTIVRDMDALPFPDFDDYFRRLSTSPLREQVEPLLFFETARGCWWGQKHHCVFCGLNGSSMTFRSKSADRAVDELRHLVDRYQVRRACAADNILDHRYFNTFLPRLIEARLGLKFVYELKTNLTRKQIGTLLAAGLGAAQLGVETLITPVLKLIDKGATGLQNLQTLKWFSDPGIEVKWNLLYGFAGEEPADYAWLLRMLPSLYHLAAPIAVGQVRPDRFSPFFRTPAAYGLVNLRPHAAFPYVYPFPQEVLARMAYYFEHDFADGRHPLDYAAAVVEAAETWQRLDGTVSFRQHDGPDGSLVLHDTRPCAVSFQRRLTGLDRELYLFCDSGRSLEAVVQHAAGQGAPRSLDPASIRRLLDGWVTDRLMAYLDGRYLSLALRARQGSAEELPDHSRQGGSG
jgi:ribosomal peptide maturation radical SAM protein 1